MQSRRQHPNPRIAATVATLIGYLRDERTALLQGRPQEAELEPGQFVDGGHNNTAILAGRIVNKIFELSEASERVEVTAEFVNYLRNGSIAKADNENLMLEMVKKIDERIRALREQKADAPS